jgi:hypothetical protein
LQLLSDPKGVSAHDAAVIQPKYDLAVLWQNANNTVAVNDATEQDLIAIAQRSERRIRA